MASLFISWNVFARAMKPTEQFPESENRRWHYFLRLQTMVSARPWSSSFRDVCNLISMRIYRIPNITSRYTRCVFVSMDFFQLKSVSRQLGFTPKMIQGYSQWTFTNVLFDGMVFYHPNEIWNIGFGQRCWEQRELNGRFGNMQFVDRSVLSMNFR